LQNFSAFYFFLTNLCPKNPIGNELQAGKNKELAAFVDAVSPWY
jgi:hypothetical protein